MKTIDLLPKEAKKSDVRGLLLNIVFVLFVVVFILVLLLSIFLFDMGRVLSVRTNDYEMVNMRIQNNINKLRLYEDFKKSVDNKEAEIENLNRFEQSWHLVLMELSKSMPDKTYITYIEGNTRDFYDYISSDKEGEEKDPLVDKVEFFKIDGYAENYNDVLKLVINIEDIPGVREVWLNNISKDNISEEGIDAYSFSISTYWDLAPYAEEISPGSTGRDSGETDEGVLQEELINNSQN